MPQGNLHDQFLHVLERPALAMRAPGTKENLTRLPAVLPGKHRQAASSALNRPRTAEYWNRGLAPARGPISPLPYMPMIGSPGKRDRNASRSRSRLPKKFGPRPMHGNSRAKSGSP